MIVEVDGKRVEVVLPARLLAAGARSGGSGARTGSGATAGAAPRRRGAAAAGTSTATGDSVKAPMQATVVKLAVAEGDAVVKGDLVLVLEAMKMEQPITAHKDGTIANVTAGVGATVSSGHVLLDITA